MGNPGGLVAERGGPSLRRYPLNDGTVLIRGGCSLPGLSAKVLSNALHLPFEVGGFFALRAGDFRAKKLVMQAQGPGLSQAKSNKQQNSISTRPHHDTGDTKSVMVDIRMIPNRARLANGAA